LAQYTLGSRLKQYRCIGKSSAAQSAPALRPPARQLMCIYLDLIGNQP